MLPQGGGSAPATVRNGWLETTGENESGSHRVNEGSLPVFLPSPVPGPLRPMPAPSIPKSSHMSASASAPAAALGGNGARMAGEAQLDHFDPATRMRLLFDLAI